LFDALDSVAMSARPWFDEGPLKTALERRIAEGLFVEFYRDGNSRKHVGKVTKTAYIGYKIMLPSGEEVLVNLAKGDHVTELDVEQYQAAAEIWQREEAVLQEEVRRVRKAQADALQAELERQAVCLHEEVLTDCVARAAGCDVNDLVCAACGLRLYRSWSTAYDNDPTSQVANWDWFVRYCRKTYNGYVPKKEDYEVVNRIGTELYR
jgi:hypothetical protein